MLIDTNILIHFFTGEEDVVSTLTQIRKQTVPLFVSVITVSELLSFPQATKTERDEIERFLAENFIVLNIDLAIAKRGAILRSKKKLQLPDALIAATALEHNLPLVTRDSDFRNVPGLTIFSL